MVYGCVYCDANLKNVVHEHHCNDASKAMAFFNNPAKPFTDAFASCCKMFLAYDSSKTFLLGTS